jgi:hypothetical protein
MSCGTVDEHTATISTIGKGNILWQAIDLDGNVGQNLAVE